VTHHSQSIKSAGLSVLVTVEGEAPVMSVEAALTDTVEMLIASLAKKYGRVDIQTFSITLEDGEAACEPTKSLADLFNGKLRGRLHAHRCHRVDVSVAYNGVVKQHPFSPAATIHRVLNWAVNKDGFDVASDAHDLEIHVSGVVTPVDSSVHVGTLTDKHKCEVSLLLVPSDRHQG
jgi:hypothetical protein